MTSLILESVTRASFHTIWVFSLYLLFAGHNAPGGGFVGGLVGGVALVLRYAGGGSAAVLATVRVPPEALLGVGLLLAGATGAWSWLGGAQFLESSYFEFDLPVLGHVAASTTLPFDIGVYLVVVGLVLTLLVTLGSEEPS